MNKVKIEKAVRHLSKDPVLKKIIDELKEPDWNSGGGSENLFVSIIENIIGQQLSSGPADKITKRFWSLFTVPPYPTPKEVLKFPDQKFRDVGMSWSKVSYIKNFSKAVLERNVDLEQIKLLPDEEVIQELTKVKGIGRWTAEMILIFHLRREDVFSLGDLGLRTAVAKLYKIDRNDIKKIERISSKWKPYRTVAARYLWKSLD